MLIRTISGLIGIIILGAVLIFRDTCLFNLALALLSGIAVFEIVKAFGLNKHKSVLFSGMLYGFLSVALLEINSVGPFAQSELKVALSVVFAFSLLLIMLFSNYTVRFEDISIVFASSVFVSFGFSCYSYINSLVCSYNKSAALYVLILCACGAFIADTGAYFVGSLLGKHKLCPTISPKKSVEGFIGGLFFNTAAFPLLGLLFSQINSSLNPNFAVLAVMGFLCALTGCVGDLFASYIKRSTGIKDFGKIMPGHGGVLDRFDSFLAVVPLMYLLLSISYHYFPVF